MTEEAPAFTLGTFAIGSATPFPAMVIRDKVFKLDLVLGMEAAGTVLALGEDLLERSVTREEAVAHHERLLAVPDHRPLRLPVVVAFSLPGRGEARHQDHQHLRQQPQLSVRDRRHVETRRFPFEPLAPRDSCKPNIRSGSSF